MLKVIYPEARDDGKQWFRVEFQFEAPVVVAAADGAGSEPAAAAPDICPPLQGELF
jgi:hypothetical protein